MAREVEGWRERVERDVHTHAHMLTCTHAHMLTCTRTHAPNPSSGTPNGRLQNRACNLLWQGAEKCCLFRHALPLQHNFKTHVHCWVPPCVYWVQVTFDASEDNFHKSAKPFIRLSSTTSPDLVTQLLQEHWNLRLPRMIISVTGGATTFELPPRLDKMIREVCECISECDRASGCVCVCVCERERVCVCVCEGLEQRCTLCAVCFPCL